MENKTVNTKENNSAFSAYDLAVHRLGSLSSFLLAIAFLLVPFATQVVWKETIDWPTTFKAMAAAAAVFGPVAIIEFISYAPIIGAGGQYLSFVTGNVMNMKLPAAMAGRKIANVEAGTDEGDAISVISIAVSSIVTTIILFAGLLLVGQMVPILESPLLKPGFANVMPAIMGAIGLPMIVRDLKLASVPTVISITLTLTLGYAGFMARQGPMMILFLAISLGWAYFLYRIKQSKTPSDDSEGIA